MSEKTKSLPDIKLDTRQVATMSDDDLHRAWRDYSTVATRCSQLAAQCTQRAKLLRSQIDLRDIGKVKQSDKDTTRISKGVKSIANADTAAPVFTDHAILRYLERFKSIDMTALTQEMTEVYASGTMTSGGAIKEAGDHCFIRSPDGKIKTIIPVDWLTGETRDQAMQIYAREGRQYQDKK